MCFVFLWKKSVYGVLFLGRGVMFVLLLFCGVGGGEGGGEENNHWIEADKEEDEAVDQAVWRQN